MNLKTLVPSFSAVLGAAALMASPPQASALTFTIDEFTGGDSTVKISITQGANDNSLNFLLEIIKPPGPSNSDLTGFWGHIGDESLLGGIAVSGVEYGYNGAFDPAVVPGSNPLENTYQYVAGANAVTAVGGQNNNLNGDGKVFTGFDFGFYFAAKTGLDNPPINAVKFTLTHNGGLTEDLFAGQLFGARLQPLLGEDSSKLSGVSPIPDGGATLALLGLSMSAIGLIRRKLS